MRFGIDANIILRALLNDHPQQSLLARDLLASLGEERRGYVGISTILETFWVLRSRYRIPLQVIHEMMQHLLTLRFLDIESSQAVAQALFASKSKRAQFADVLLAERNVESGCSFTYTFDRDAAKAVPAMELLS